MRLATLSERLGWRRAAPAGSVRLGVVDVLRGAAVVAMAAYHTGWDLGALRLTVVDLREVAAWELFARVIASSFLLLVGAGLVLAHGRAFRPGAFRRRLALLAAAALIVSAATYLVFPGSWVFFGILHCIAASSVLALPFLRLPVPLVIAAAAAVIALPFLTTFDAFDAPWLAFVGLGSRVPDTNDYVPLFPWFGCVLAGIAAMRIARPWLERLPERAGRYPAPLRALAFAGRHSLLIYLLHQPLIFGALSAYAEAGGRSPEADVAPFRRTCERSCRAGGSADAACRPACDCAIAAFRQDGVWPRIAAQTTTPEDRLRIPGLARACFDRSRSGG